MGCSSSIKDHVMASQPTQAQGARINVRLLMNPADSGSNRNPKQMYESISGYRETPLLTLEQACQRLQIKSLHSYVVKAKNYSRYPKKGLQQDEQAAINLYTQQTPFYKLLNDALRQNDRRAITAWYGYLKLFLTALYKLPPYQGTIWRGVTQDLSAKHQINDEQVWWAFSSCTSSLNILESPNFLGGTGLRTLFNIEVFDGRLISDFSEYATEDEILLLPGTHLRVVGKLKQPGGLHIIQLKQIKPSYFLFESSEQDDPPFRSPVPYEHPQTKFSSYDTSGQGSTYSEGYYEVQNMTTANSSGAFQTQIELAKNISSDSEKAQVLKHILTNKNLTDQTIAGIAECVDTMYAAKEKADVLQLVAKRSGLSHEQFRVSVKAAGGISNDNQKALAIKAFLVHEQFTVQHLDVVLSAAKTMYASGDKATVFTELIRNRYLNAQHFPSVLDGIQGISGDSQKSDVLCKLARRLPKGDAAVRQAYLKAADSIYASKDKAAATMAFASDSASKGMTTTNSSAAFQTQIELAKNISSDSEKAQVLKHILTNKNLTDQTIAGIAECVDTMYAAKEKADVLQLVAKRSGLSHEQFRVSVKAAGGISNDNQKALAIKAFLVHEQFTVQHLDVVLSAAKTMYARGDKASVFTELIRNRHLNAQHFPSVLDGIQEISGDSQKSDVLCKLAPRLPKGDAAVRQAYLKAADSIYASKDKAAATMAFM